MKQWAKVVGMVVLLGLLVPVAARAQPIPIPPGCVDGLLSSGARSLICVPLQVRSHVLGAMTFLSLPGRLYGPADLGRALDLAVRTAIAVENARLYQELIESDHRKSEFLAMLAHELRNPLVPISNAVHLLKGLSGFCCRRNSIPRSPGIESRHSARVCRKGG